MRWIAFPLINDDEICVIASRENLRDVPQLLIMVNAHLNDNNNNNNNNNNAV